jgi:hypothetical protein
MTTAACPPCKTSSQLQPVVTGSSTSRWGIPELARTRLDVAGPCCRGILELDWSPPGQVPSWDVHSYPIIPLQAAANTGHSAPNKATPQLGRGFVVPRSACFVDPPEDLRHSPTALSPIDCSEITQRHREWQAPVLVMKSKR